MGDLLPAGVTLDFSSLSPSMDQNHCLSFCLSSLEKTVLFALFYLVYLLPVVAVSIFALNVNQDMVSAYNAL